MNALLPVWKAKQLDLPLRCLTLPQALQMTGCQC